MANFDGRLKHGLKRQEMATIASAFNVLSPLSSKHDDKAERIKPKVAGSSPSFLIETM